MSSEQRFESDYFSLTYQGKYKQRNPPYKWKSFVREISKYKKSGRLLDVGCALGQFLQQANKIYECDGFDVSNYALRLARRRLPENVRLGNGSLDQIEGESIYDVITCFDVIEHIVDLDGVWKDLQRLLKSDGILVISLPVYDGPLGWLVDRLDHDTTHVHRRDRKFWLNQVREHFSLQSYTGIWRYFFFQRYYLHILSRWSRAWTTAIMLIGKKLVE
jgi:2-polyprenyl-3-methyl-5-hydroxy-6-metoxy-1,4-benzoquinol methylase